MTETRNAPTLLDVANLAGVSTATVSRCLNFPEQVSEQTTRKVMAAVERLGYTPNFAARAMVAQRTRTIGAIIPTMENAVFARGLQAFQEELDAQGYTLLVASSSYRPELEERQIRSLVARGADALLLIGYARDPELYRFFEARGVPALVTWAFDPMQPRPSIGFDNRKAMQDLAAEVLRLGHRDIGFISVDGEANDRVSGRLAGLRSAIGAARAETRLTIEQTHYSIEAGAEAFSALMAADHPPTAILCANDVLAVGALRRARAEGLDVPRDISITGFDDIELAQVTHPELTTVHVPHKEMGRLAAKALIALLEDGAEIERHELTTNLRLRASLGPPAAKAQARGN